MTIQEQGIWQPPKGGRGKQKATMVTHPFVG